MNRHRLEITFGMDVVSLSVEPPAQFILTQPEEGKTALTTRTGGNLRTFSLSSNDFAMEEASPLTGFVVQVETPNDILKCSLEQSPVSNRQPNTLVAIKEPAYAVKVRVDGSEPLFVPRSNLSPLIFEVPLPAQPEQ